MTVKEYDALPCINNAALTKLIAGMVHIVMGYQCEAAVMAVDHIQILATEHCCQLHGAALLSSKDTCLQIFKNGGKKNYHFII